ncbi:MAG: hypothetical protein KJ674_03950 [Nanoarchaeota archaeon]|nr:hypothetical protein [Nanoarchaeota archaeon]
MKNKKQKTISLFIITIMVLSVLGFIFGGGEEPIQNELTYNGFEFVKIQDKFMLELEGKQFYFDYFPDELQEVIVPPFTITSPKYYFIFTPDEKDANIEYSMAKLQTSLNNFNVKIVLACDSEENCPDIPIKDCTEYAFYFQKSDTNSISLDENCIILEGENQFLSQAVDSINYRLIGVL